MYRLIRDLSICTTCLLNVLQAITLSLIKICFAKFKNKSSTQNLYSFLFLWVFNMLISGCLLISTVTWTHLLVVTESFSLLPMNRFLQYLFSTLTTFWNVSLIGLMALSSGYFIILLSRHNTLSRQTQYLHSTNLSPKTLPERRGH